MDIDLELTEKSAKNTQRWWKLTATLVVGVGLKSLRLRLSLSLITPAQPCLN